MASALTSQSCRAWSMLFRTSSGFTSPAFPPCDPAAGDHPEESERETEKRPDNESSQNMSHSGADDEEAETAGDKRARGDTRKLVAEGTAHG